MAMTIIGKCSKPNFINPKRWPLNTSASRILPDAL